MSSPVLTIIAGSNGCGKSTLTSSAKNKFQQTPILDPDAIAESLQDMISETASNIDAGKRVLRLATDLIAARQSFTVETTLSGSTYLRMAATAKESGYLIIVVFVGTNSVEINIQRVKERVIKGGHNVPEEDQRRRYPRTLTNMARLLPMADLAIILDNSGDGYVLVASGHTASMHWNKPIPAWARTIKPGTE